jgi:hypothetical protein
MREDLRTSAEPMEGAISFKSQEGSGMRTKLLVLCELHMCVWQSDHASTKKLVSLSRDQGRVILGPNLHDQVSQPFALG